MALNELLKSNPKSWLNINANSAEITQDLIVSGTTTLNNVQINGNSTGINVTPNVGSIASMASGIYNDDISFNIDYSYFGTPGSTPVLITLHFPSVVGQASSSNNISISPGLPSNLQMHNSTNFWVPIIDNGAFPTSGGVITFENGNISVAMGGQNPFTGSGSSGWSEFYISYFLQFPNN